MKKLKYLIFVLLLFPVSVLAGSKYVYIDDAHISKNLESKFEIDVDFTEFIGAYNLIYGNLGDEKIIAKVYDYTLDTAKEFESKGWKLTGTFYNFLTFVKNK